MEQGYLQGAEVSWSNFEAVDDNLIVAGKNNRLVG